MNNLLLLRNFSPQIENYLTQIKIDCIHAENKWLNQEKSIINDVVR